MCQNFRSVLAAILAIAAFGSANAHAQWDPYAPGQQSVNGAVPLRYGWYARVRHFAGEGVGWDDTGYTNVGLFAPLTPADDPTRMVFVDGRIWVTNEGDPGGNLGIGGRK